MAAPNGIGREIWLLLLSQGGRWTASEISDSIHVPAKTVGTAAACMADSGRLKRHRGRKDAYSVTPDCIVPIGVTVADVLAVSE